LTAEKYLNEVCEAVQGYEEKRLFDAVRKALEMGVDPSEIIERGIAKGLKIVGTKFEQGDLFITDLISAAEPAQRAVNELLAPALKERAGTMKTLGKVILGTVEGDIHSIGKNLVGAMFFAAGFEVVDLGEDVPPQNFAEKAKEVDADIVGASALLTTTMPNQKSIVEVLKSKGIRSKTMFGGAPCTPNWVKEIGGDGYAENAMQAVTVAKQLLGMKD
jgi:corrinoid protein of di/trimethylamine methyltransferase